MENVVIYARTKKAKEAEKQRRLLTKYCNECDYNVLNTYVDYELDKATCNKSIIEMSRKKKFNRIVMLNFDSLGNNSSSISLELDFLKRKGKDVEVVNPKKSIKILMNDFIRGINHNAKKIFNSKYRELHSARYRSKCNIYNKYYRRTKRGGK